MSSKSPNRHWKTADWKASGQLMTLEKEQADLLKCFSRHLNELEGYLTQNKTMTAEGAYRCFFETYDNLEDNRQQQRLLLKPKYFESFDNGTKRMLEEKRKVLPQFFLHNFALNALNFCLRIQRIQRKIM